MDFIDLATWSHDILRRQLQYSAQQQQQVVATVEDDDFAHLSSSLRASPSSQYGYHDSYNAPSTRQSDSIVDHYKSNTYYYNNYMDEYDTTPGSGNSGIGSHPFFSKSAEAELYVLATNFLLYVAMVIITIIVAKIYFPESLQRGRGGGGGTGSRSSSDNDLQRQASSGGLRRSYSYHRREEEGGGSILGVPITSSTTTGSSLDDSFYYEDEVLDSGADVEEDDKDYDEDDDDDIQELTGDRKKKRTSRSSMNFLEFDQERASQRKVVQRLLFCSLMLNVTFVAWGALQVSYSWCFELVFNSDCRRWRWRWERCLRSLGVDLIRFCLVRFTHTRIIHRNGC